MANLKGRLKKTHVTKKTLSCRNSTKIPVSTTPTDVSCWTRPHQENKCDENLQLASLKTIKLCSYCEHAVIPQLYAQSLSSLSLTQAMKLLVTPKNIKKKKNRLLSLPLLFSLRFNPVSTISFMFEELCFHISCKAPTTKKTSPSCQTLLPHPPN